MNKINLHSLKQKLKSDSSLQLLVATNLVIITIALAQQWNAVQVLFIYWGQSVALGVINIFRIFTIKVASKERIGRRAGISAFFIFHYGLFHLVYLKFIFLIAEITKADLDYHLLFYPILLLFINHLFSFIKNRKKDNKLRKNLKEVMMYPYKRIKPMHITIVVFLFIQVFLHNSGVLVFFMLLKTYADAKSHIIEHNLT